MKFPFQNSLFGIIATVSFSAPIIAESSFVAAAAPRSGLIQIACEGQAYLSFGYGDWDSNWGSAKREMNSSAEGDTVTFTYHTTLPKSSASFDITGSWKRTTPDTFRFEAELVANQSADLTMAQFSLKPGASFTSAIAIDADKRSTPVDLPLRRTPIGDAVSSLVLKDKAGRTVTLLFDSPVQIAVDGAARLILVRDRMEAGKRYPLAFTLKLPESSVFYADAGSVPSSTEGWYEFNGKAPIPADSEWNMSSWLEAPAGKHGRILRREDRLFYNGNPTKLWGINVCYANCAPDKALADRRADFYAAVGINAVRLHKYADGPGWAGIVTKDSNVTFEPTKLDQMDYFVAALKKRGIYTKLSPVFMMKLGPGDRAAVPYMDELGSPRGNRINPGHGSFYLSTEIQDLLLAQLTNLLTHTNPHTGLTYAADPAIAYVEIYNEDSALFGGVSGALSRSRTLRERGGRLFSAWLKTKYINEKALLSAWGETAFNNHSLLTNTKVPADESWKDDRIYPVGNPWFFAPENLNGSQKSLKRRLLDTMAFLYDLQNQVYARYAKAIRATGYEGEIITSNWQAGLMMSHFYNLHSDYLAGTIDRHNYFGGGGDFPFNNSSMLANIGSGIFGSSFQQVGNRPFMLSEWIHARPNEWSVEGPAIIGAYGMGLQGWDVSFAFQNTDQGTWSTNVDAEWDAAAPNFLGVFPAVSRQVLRGDVKESEIVHTRNVHVPSLDSENVGFTERVVQQGDVKSFDSDAFPSAALAAARGVVRFTDTFTPTKPFDLDAYRKNDGIIASTGQLFWRPGANSKDGHIVIDTPATQAVIGFAEGRAIALADATVTPTSRYGALYLTARSAEGTLANEKTILITAIARVRNAGAVIAGDTFLFSPGTMKDKWHPAGPVLMEPVKATILLKRPGLPVVHILDQNGVKTGRTLLVKDQAFTIDTGRDSTPYYIIEYK
ncbi:MAG: hypothetical protein K0R17_3377 [Rariglobus sp.]|jgi:hypothetical protein|nr:hypothetical protein [Rariglobus sp.]